MSKSATSAWNISPACSRWPPQSTGVGLPQGCRSPRIIRRIWEVSPRGLMGSAEHPMGLPEPQAVSTEIRWTQWQTTNWDSNRISRTRWAEAPGDLFSTSMSMQWTTQRFNWWRMSRMRLGTNWEILGSIREAPCSSRCRVMLVTTTCKLCSSLLTTQIYRTRWSSKTQRPPVCTTVGRATVSQCR